MGQDYLARKASKKRAKKESRGASAGDTKRERQQRTTPKRRLGVCWGQPVLTPADRYASDEEGPVDASSFDVLAGASIRAIFAALRLAIVASLGLARACKLEYPDDLYSLYTVAASNARQRTAILSITRLGSLCVRCVVQCFCLCRRR